MPRKILLEELIVCSNCKKPINLTKKRGYKSLSKKFPMNWGTTPLSILPDIKDRLLSPIYYRYSTKSFSKLLKKSNLQIQTIREDYSGIYPHATKI